MMQELSVNLLNKTDEVQAPGEITFYRYIIRVLLPRDQDNVNLLT